MNEVRCMVCGGQHQPSPTVCDPDGMDRVAKKIGSEKWNRLTRPTGLRAILALFPTADGQATKSGGVK